jgi:hypothetical protein
VSRLKGLGETMAAQLKEATMDPKKRTLLRVKTVAEEQNATEKSVERPIGSKPEARFEFIQERAGFADDASGASSHLRGCRPSAPEPRATRPSRRRKMPAWDYLKTLSVAVIRPISGLAEQYWPSFLAFSTNLSKLITGGSLSLR